MLITARQLPTLAGLLLLVCACVSAPKADPEARRLAQEATENNAWIRAMDRWNTVLQRSGGVDPEARHRLAEALLESDRGLGAIQVLRGGEPVPGTELEHGLLLARAHVSQQQTDAAGRVLSALLAHHADNLQVLTICGESLLDGPQEAKGLGLLLQALRLDAGDGTQAEEVAVRAGQLGLADMEGEAWTLRLDAPAPPAEAFVGAAAWDMARAAAGDTEPLPKTLLSLQRAVQLDPQYARAWRLIGDLHAGANQALEARQAYREAMDVDPGDWDSCLSLASMYASLGDCVEATIWIDHALAVLTEDSDREPFEELQRGCE